MQVIPVLDVRHGQAVHAIAGHRDHYGPLRSVLHEGTDPLTLARAGQRSWKLPDLYLADLDAILGEASPDLTLYRRLADLGLTLWIDSGVKDASDVPRLIEAGVARVIVGLETVRGPGPIAEILGEIGQDRLVFSLDLREGRPIVAPGSEWRSGCATEIASEVIDCGVERIIVLDLARVGTGRGLGLGLGPESLDPRASWYAGGGIAGIEGIRSLEGSGYRGVLVGSALHDGRISPDSLGEWVRSHPTS